VTLDPFVRCAAKPARVIVESKTTHELAVGYVSVRKKIACVIRRTESDRFHPSEIPGSSLPSLDLRRHANYSKSLSAKNGVQWMVRLSRRRRCLILSIDCHVARVGPTTPKRATTSLAASVDPTDARKQVQNSDKRCRQTKANVAASRSS
jgi:hypothetical protein